MGTRYDSVGNLDKYCWLDTRDPQADVEQILNGGFVDMGIICLTAVLNPPEAQANVDARLRGEFKLHEFRIEI